jgi:MYXO-CTERM domain-containing protein
MTLKKACCACAAAAALLAPTFSQASLVTHQYAALGGTHWAVNFAVVNDGSPASFAGFSVYFTPGAFSNLSLASSPAGWDSVVIQPDLALPSPGFFDTFAIAAQSVPGVGQSQAGFRVLFDWTGPTPDPGRLRFTLNDANFNVIGQGLTVPEPGSVLLAALGLGALALTQRRGRPTGAQLHSEQHNEETCA